MDTQAESLLDQAATQFMMGEQADTVAALVALSKLVALNKVAMPPEAMQLATELRLLAEQSWANPEQLGLMEQGLDRLRLILSAVSADRLGSDRVMPVQSNALNQDPELVGDFVLEAREHLQTVETGLLILEKDPANQDTLNAVFRSFHTIKGLAGFLEFAEIQALSHEVETILDQARTGELMLTPNLIDLTLESADYVGQEVLRIEAQLHGQVAQTPTDSTALLRRVQAVIAGEELAASPIGRARPANQVVVTTENEMTSRADAAAVTEAVVPPEVVVGGETVPTQVAAPEVEGKIRTRAAVVDTHAIRVDTAKLDYLLDMVGEMVIAESMVRLDPELAGNKNPKLQRNLNQLRRVTEEVQKVAMATRLIPVGTLFQRVNRLVRDTSRKAGKKAEVELVGEDTQLDKTIIEELTDPIMHMVRNSIDHGIEAPTDRRKAGKPDSGTIQLKAYRQADHIQIEISDDGRGLNQEKILSKARERGVIAENAQLSDSEIFQLIFEPGFSTADKVTDISGRGVGMDVVKKQIQKLRGKIEITSTPGKGTTFFLKLPLTLAIVEGLVVGVGRERLILPIFSVHEMFRPIEGQVSTVQGRGEMVMVRNQLLPLIRLYRSLGLRARKEIPEETLLIVAETEGRRFVLMVDEFIGKQEVVIKSLGESLRNTPGVAGGAILGDGRVGLILDLTTIYNDRGTKAAVLRESVLVAC